MKTALLALVTFALWLAVIGGGLRVWDTDMDAREAMDACLADGYTLADCTKGDPR
mgnify:CR=1 FL=1